jgi:pyridoxine 5-phosphate synthase
MRLHINIDHIATVRQARRTNEPDPVRAAVLAELGGADGITVHLREDRRHIQDRDVRVLMQTVRTGLNFELAAAQEVVAIACEVKPMAATLVPERREEITTEGGLALHERAQRERVEAAVQQLRAQRIRTSLFIDPDPAAVRIAADLGVDAIELHTGQFAEAWKAAGTPWNARSVRDQLIRLREASEMGCGAGLDIHAGHGLTYENVSDVAAIRSIEEVNIGHSIVSRAVLVGMEAAVREMKRIILQARTGAVLPE